MSPGQKTDLGHGATLHTSGCLCPPDRSEGPHRCIHAPTNWVHYDGAWYRSAVRSWHKARAIARRCESWGQVVADLDLVLWVEW